MVRQMESHTLMLARVLVLVLVLATVTCISGCATRTTIGNPTADFGIGQLLSDFKADLASMRNLHDTVRLKAAINYLCHERLQYTSIPGNWCADAETAIGLLDIMFGSAIPTPAPSTNNQSPIGGVK